MKQVNMAAIALSVVLGTGFLAGCGSRENPAAAPSTPTTETATPPTTTAPATKPSQGTNPPTQPSTTGETAINPPQSAALKAQDPQAQINLRSQPTADSASQGYGLVGDPIKLLKASEGTDGLTWYYVKFDKSGAEGWIRGDFINTAGPTANNRQGAGVSIDNFTTDEIFAVGSGGCGMTLMPVGTSQFIFFNGLEDTGMWMKIDGQMTQFRRTAASGPEFYGQAGTQSFVSQDGAIQVDVTVSQGAQAGHEVIAIESGTLRLKTDQGVTEMPVSGDAGC